MLKIAVGNGLVGALALLGVAVSASAATLENGAVALSTVKKGASINELAYKGLVFDVQKLRAFNDRFCRNSGKKICEFENAGREEWTLDQKPSVTGDWQTIRYALTPKAFNDFHVRKTYALHKTRNVMRLTWDVKNVDTEDRDFGLSTVVSAFAGAGVNCYAVPREAGVARWDYPGNTAPMEVSVAPRQRWCAFWEKDSGRGVVIRWPEGRVAGFTSWMGQGGSRHDTLEYFGVSETVKAGETLTLTAEMEFSDDVPSVLKTLDLPVGKLVAPPLVFLKKYVDPAFRKCAVAVTRPHVRAAVDEAAAAKILAEDFNIPLGFLSQVHTNTATYHEPWIKPSAACDVLYLLDPGGSFLGNGMRFLVELLQRTDLTYRTLPLLRQVLSVSGGKPYSVYTTTFTREMDDWTMARLRKVRKLPKVAIVQNVDFKGTQREFREILAAWQAKDVGFLFVGCSNVPPELLGTRAPEMEDVLFQIPVLQKTKTRYLTISRKGAAGPWVVVVGKNDTRQNPACPPQRLADNAPVYSGTDFPYFDYWYLPIVRALRLASGVEMPVRVVSAAPEGLVVDAAQAGACQLQLEVKDLHRGLEHRATRAVTLVSGRQKLVLADLPRDLAGGTHAVHVRLLDASGRVSDAAAFRFDVPDQVSLALAYSHTNRIYAADEHVDLTVRLTGARPEGATCRLELEDVCGRIVRRATRPAEPENAFSFALPADPTRLYRVRAIVAQGNRAIAQTWGEFSVRARPPDLKDTSAYITISGGGTAPFAFLRDCGFDFLISHFYTGARPMLEECANLNIQSVPRNCADKHDWFLPYRSDAKGDGSGVRKPCFSSPEFQRELTERIETVARKTDYDYYNVRLHWLGDECFLGSDVCTSPSCLAAFRRELAAKYGTIEKLNAEWGANFATFEAVRPTPLGQLKGRDNLAPWLEHRLYMARTFAREWVGTTQKILDRVAPGSICGPTGTQVPGIGYDWAQLMKYVGAAGYYFGAQRKCVHDFAHWYGRDVLAGQCGGGYTHTHYDYEPYNYDTMWSGLLKGSNLAYHYYGAAIYGDIAATSNFVYWTTSMQELKRGIGKLFLSGEEKCEIAVLYSQASLFAAMANGAAGPWQNAQTSWWRLLSDLKFPFRFYPYELLAERGVPAGVRVFVLPHAHALSDAELTRLAEFRRRGGRVLADVAPGAYRESGRKRAVPPETCDALIGPELAEYNAVAGGGIGGETSTEKGASAELAARLRAAVSQELARAGVRPICQVTTAKGAPFACDAALRYDGANRIFALHLDTHGADNNGVGEGAATSTALGRFEFTKGEGVRAKLEKPGHVYDVRAGKYLGFTDVIDTTIIPGWTRIYSILAKKPGGVFVEGPDHVRAGTAARFRFGATNAEGPHVFHIELVAPDGACPWFFRRNVRTTTGSGEYTFETAFNEQPGTWQLHIRHVNTGAEAQAKVELQAPQN